MSATWIGLVIAYACIAGLSALLPVLENRYPKLAVCVQALASLGCDVPRLLDAVSKVLTTSWLATAQSPPPRQIQKPFEHVGDSRTAEKLEREADRPRALARGVLFGGFETPIDCYLLSDGRRLISLAGTVHAVRASLESVHAGETGGDAFSHFLAQWLRRYADFTLGAEVEFEVVLAQGGTILVVGGEAPVLIDACMAYVDAVCGAQLEGSEAHVARSALSQLMAFAKLGLDALIDEATGYAPARVPDTAPQAVGRG